jgi:hypothetical protein
MSLCLSWVSIHIRSIASAIDSSLVGSKYIAAFPATSGIEVEFDAATGTSHSMASRTGIPKPSKSDGKSGLELRQTIGLTRATTRPVKVIRSLNLLLWWAASMEKFEQVFHPPDPAFPECLFTTP